MKANYHTHTHRCNHAQGPEEGYIRAAAEQGYQVLGFADHTPWPFASGFESTIRMKPDMLPDYVNTLRQLREKWQGQITLRIGLECEYFPAYMNWLREIKEAWELDHLLLGLHYLESEEVSPYVPGYCKKAEGLRAYTDAACEGMETGLYAYMAHPDLFMRFRRRWDKDCEKAAHDLITTSRKMGMPLEYNLNGLMVQAREHEPGYPRQEFWEFAAGYDVPVIIGVDAHSPSLIADGALWEKARGMLTGLGLKVLDCLPMDEHLKEENK